MRLGYVVALGALLLSALAPSMAHAQSMRSTQFGVSTRIGGARIHYGQQSVRVRNGGGFIGGGIGSGWYNLPPHPAYWGMNNGVSVQYNYDYVLDRQRPSNLVRGDLMPAERPWWFDNCDRRYGPVYDIRSRSYVFADPYVTVPADRIIIREIQPGRFDCSGCRGVHTTDYCPFQTRAYYEFLDRYRSADCTYCGARGHFLRECSQYASVTREYSRVETRVVTPRDGCGANCACARR